MKIFNWLFSIYQYITRDIETDYLNGAKDIYDLERRMKEIDTNKAHWQVRCQSALRHQHHW